MSGKHDLSGRAVELPDGSTFEFAWDMDVYPIPREQIEEHGLPKGILRDSVGDVVALARMLDAWEHLSTSKLTTELAILWELHHRVDCLLHAITATVTMADVEMSGAQIALDNVRRIRGDAYQAREFADLDPIEVDAGVLGALGSLLGGIGGRR